MIAASCLNQTPLCSLRLTTFVHPSTKQREQGFSGQAVKEITQTEKEGLRALEVACWGNQLLKVGLLLMFSILLIARWAQWMAISLKKPKATETLGLF